MSSLIDRDELALASCTCQAASPSDSSRPRAKRNEPEDRPAPVFTGKGRSAGLVGLGWLPRKGRVPVGLVPQGSSAFFCEIRRRTRSARSAPSNGFLNASLNPSAKVSSPGSSLVKASRIVPR